MKPVHERNQECLPPKKRDLPQSCVNYEQAVTSSCSSTTSSCSGEAPDLSRGLLIVAGPSEVGLRYSVAAENCEERASVTLDQYGYFYNMAVPPSVVSMSSLPPAIIQHPAIPFPPIHCAPVSPTSVQYLGSPYALPSFLSAPVTLATTHPPHYVPYGSIITERTTATALQNSTFRKAPSHPVDLPQGRVPVFYHHPSVYSVHEVPLACTGSGTVPAVQTMRKRGPTAEELREQECNQGRTIDQILDLHSQLTDVTLHGAAGEHVSDGQLFSGYQTARAEVMVPAHRDTPDTDLEVQRVVSGLNCQSPVNLSHIVTESQDELRTGQRHPPEAAAEKGQMESLYVASSLQEVAHTNLCKPMTISNGELGHVPVGSEQGLVSDVLGIRTPEAHGERELVVKNSFVFATAPMQPPNPSRMPSHFMKGAIIQLATGELKRVEDLQTQDFVQSAEVSGGLKIDSSTVVDIEDSQWPGLVTLHFIVGEQQSKVSLDVPPEHPFFVYGQGWSSCSPGQTTEVFALPCHRLQVGDVCISISLQSLNDNSASLSPKGRTSPWQKQQYKEMKGVSQRDSELLSSPETSGHYCCSNTGFQRYNLQAAGTQPSPLHPSFIPQEVKLSIEGRSNAGK